MGTAATGGDTPGLLGALRWLPRGLRSPAALRARWGIVDQGISSFTNFAVTAVVAHQVDPAAFGAFSVALTMYICVLWVARSMVGEPFVVRMTASSVAAQITAAGDAMGTAVAIGLATGGAAVTLGLLLGGVTGRALAAMGLFLPVLLAQDAERYVLMARGRARGAAANDATWAVVQFAVTALLLLVHRADGTWLTVAFGTGAAAGAVVGIGQTGSRPTLSRTRSWLHDRAEEWVAFLLELLTVNATPQLSMLAVAALGQVVVVGAVKAGMFLFAPLSVLFSGLYLVALPEAVRLRARTLSGLKVFVVSLAVGMSALTFAWAGAVALVPASLGRALLGANWASGRAVLWPVAALTAASATILSSIVGLRALGVARQTIRVRIWIGPVVFVSGIVGAELGGALGTATALAISSWLSAGLSWFVLRRSLAAATLGAAAPAPLLDSLAGQWT